jgi:hypothetical protein
VQKFIGLMDVCQQPAHSFNLPVPAGGSTSWPGLALTILDWRGWNMYAPKNKARPKTGFKCPTIAVCQPIL